MNDSPVHSSTYYYENGDAPAQVNQGSNGDGQPGYDANGNLTSYKGWTYTYDAQNRLTTATNETTSAEFYYDGKNRQIARKIGPRSGGGGVIRFSAWDNWELLEEYSDHLNVTTGYLQGATGVIESWSPVTGDLYYYQDKLGSTTHVANANGQLVESYKYDLYGTPSYFNSTSQPLNSSTYNIVDLYAGERWIPELGLHDLRNRFMSPELGRFLQPDPIGFKGDASNLYRYCGNDPIDKSDPMGLENPPAQVVGGTFWAMEKFFDSSSTFQGGLNEWMNSIRPQAGMDGGGGGGDAGGGSKGRQNADDLTIKQMRTQLDGVKDTTTAIVPGSNGPEVTSAATEVKTPRGGSATGAFGYSGARETLNVRSDAQRLIHAHTREAKIAALPSKEDDYGAVQGSKGIPMYFTSRYLARHGQDPTGQHKGNYIILHYTGRRADDIPRLEYRFDSRLTMPPLRDE